MMNNYTPCYTTVTAFARMIDRRDLLFKLHADWQAWNRGQVTLEALGRKYATYPIMIRAYENWFLKW